MSCQPFFFNRPIFEHPKKDKMGTELPDDACCHQKLAKPHEIGARIGRTADGRSCCPEAVEPSGMSMPNMQD